MPVGGLRVIARDRDDPRGVPRLYAGPAFVRSPVIVGVPERVLPGLSTILPVSVPTGVIEAPELTTNVPKVMLARGRLEVRGAAMEGHSA